MFGVSLYSQRVRLGDFFHAVMFPELFSFPVLDNQIQFLLVCILVNLVKHRFTISLLTENNSNFKLQFHCWQRL